MLVHSEFVALDPTQARFEIIAAMQARAAQLRAVATHDIMKTELAEATSALNLARHELEACASMSVPFASIDRMIGVPSIRIRMVAEALGCPGL